MTNPFDQFDIAPTQTQTPQNPFDQFDSAPQEVGLAALDLGGGTDMDGSPIMRMRETDYNQAVNDGLLSNNPNDPNYQEVETVGDDWSFEAQIPRAETRRESMVSGLRDFADDNDIAFRNQDGSASLIDVLTDAPVKGLANVIEDPVNAFKQTGKALVVDPAIAVATLPANLVDSLTYAGEARRQRKAGNIEAANEWQRAANKKSIKATVGVVDAATVGRGGAALRTGKHATKTGAKQAAQSTMSGSQKKAKKALYRAAKLQGKSPAQVDAAIAKARADGNPETFWQHLELDDIASGISTKGGAPAKVIEKQMLKENIAQSGQVRDLFKNALKNPKVGLSPGKVEAEFKRAAKKNYGEAFKVNFRPSKELGDHLNLTEMQKRLAAAEKFLKETGRRDYTQTELLHKVKTTLDGDINKLFISGAGGDAKDMRRVLLKPLLKELDAQNPAYAHARKLYAKGNSSKNATKLGEKFFGIDEDYFADIVKGMSQSELASLQNGIMRAVRKQMDKPDRITKVRAAFENPSFRRKLKSIMPDEDLDKLMAGLNEHRIRFARNARANAKNNSATASRQEAVKMLDTALEGGIRRTGQAAGGLIKETRRSVANGLAKVLGKGSERAVRRMDAKTVQTMADIMAAPIKDAPDIFRKMPANRRKKFVDVLNKTAGGNNDKVTIAKKLAILDMIGRVDNALTKEIEIARKAINDNAQEAPTTAKTEQRTPR